MKKILLIAAFMVVTLFAIGQDVKPTMTASDSLSVMFQRMEQTELQLGYMNKNLRLHSGIAMGSFAMMGVSAFSFYRMSVAEGPGSSTYHTGPDGSWVENPTDWQKVWKTVGITTGIMGGVAFIASFIPTLNNKLTFDGQRLNYKF